jgi:hypothetical protein
MLRNTRIRVHLTLLIGFFGPLHIQL